MKPKPLKRGKPLKRTKLRKNGQRPIAKIKRELDVDWSRAVRSRFKVCAKCRKAPASQAAHIFSRRHLSTRWDPRNGTGLCFYCHIIWGHREPVEFTLWVKQEIGENLFEVLRKKAQEIYSETSLKKDFEKIKKELTQ